MIDRNPALPTAEEYSPEAREPGGYRHSDATIREQICRQLVQDDGLDDSGIVVEVKDGEVTMGGTVRRCADMQRAEQHACATEGVRLVRNGLASDEPLPPVDALAKPAGAATKMGKPGYER